MVQGKPSARCGPSTSTQSCGAELFEGRVNPVHVVVVVEGIEKIHDLFAVSFAEFRKILSQITDLRSDHRPSGRLQSFGYRVQVADLGEEPSAFATFGDFFSFQWLNL